MFSQNFKTFLSNFLYMFQLYEYDNNKILNQISPSLLIQMLPIISLKMIIKSLLKSKNHPFIKLLGILYIFHNSK